LPDLREILKKILRSYEFNITEESQHYILAEKEGSSVGAGILPSTTKVLASDISSLRMQLPPNLDKIIFVTTLEVDSEIEEIAQKEDILLWDKNKLTEEIGRAVLSSVGEEFLFEKPENVAVEEKVVQLEEVAQPEEVIQPHEVGPKEEEIKVEDLMTSEEEIVAEDIERLEEMASDADQSFKIEPIEVLIEPKGEVKPKNDEEIGEVIMKPEITMSDVSEISKKIIQGFRFDLELIPYYVFEYSCELVVEGQNTPQISTGTLAVNGLTNNAESWEFTFETVADLETTHTKLEPKFDENKAFETAKESAITLNTKEVQTIDDRGAVTIYEKKKVSPKEGAIDIQRRGLIYLPVWCVEGSNGVMIINANSGKVIKEDIYRESDDLYSRSSSRSFSF
jgi:hypothetical protein